MQPDFRSNKVIVKNHLIGYIFRRLCSKLGPTWFFGRRIFFFPRRIAKRLTLMDR